MSRRAALALLLSTVGLFAFPRLGEAPVARLNAGIAPAPPAVAAPREPSVRIEQEVVQPKVIFDRNRVAAVRKARATVPHTASPRTPTGARRVFFGDGKYRPEPFPRIASR